jgi:threonine dehydrogenase-like Zn-dependent dehydrogenase
MGTKAMKTFIMKGIGKVGFASKPIPTAGPNDAVVKTTMALVCTSDVHTVKGAIGDRDNLTLGHEAVGVVHELGDAVQGFKKGDRVAINAITPCYKCENCLRGHTSHCQQMLGGWKFANVKEDYVNIPRLDWGVGMSDKTIKTGLCPGGRERMKRLMRLIDSGKVDPTKMTTHTFKFGEVDKAFRMMETKEDGIIKPLIEF